jgi:Outer membrane lipoprotein-sorting protein
MTFFSSRSLFYTGLVLALTLSSSSFAKANPSEDLISKLLQPMGTTGISGEIHMRVTSDGDRLKRIQLRMRYDDKGQAMRLDFLEPPKVKGMKFVATAMRDRDDRWMMYIQAIRRVMNLPLSAENHMVRDMINLGFYSPRNENFKYTPTGEEITSGAIKLLGIDAMPVDSAATRQFGFQRARLWADPATGLVHQTDFYQSDQVVRVQKVLVWGGPGGRFPQKIFAKDNSDGKETKVEVKNLTETKDLNEELFSRRALQRK